MAGTDVASLKLLELLGGAELVSHSLGGGCLVRSKLSTEGLQEVDVLGG